MAQQSSTNQILQRLKVAGPQTAKALGEHLGMTSMGARQHLQQLELEEQVCWDDISSGRGRPSRYWRLTQEAWNRFPDNHAELTITMIDSVEAVFGSDGLEQMISHREQQISDRYSEALNGQTTLEQKLNTLVDLRNQEGYMAQWLKDESGYWLVENHCPICAAASRCRNFCRSELKLFRQLFASEATVDREDYILDGARRCSYRIHPV